jgi:hypothetical protein
MILLGGPIRICEDPLADLLRTMILQLPLSGALADRIRRGATALRAPARPSNGCRRRVLAGGCRTETTGLHSLREVRPITVVNEWRVRTIWGRTKISLRRGAPASPLESATNPATLHPDIRARGGRDEQHSRSIPAELFSWLPQRCRVGLAWAHRSQRCAGGGHALRPRHGNPQLWLKSRRWPARVPGWSPRPPRANEWPSRSGIVGVGSKDDASSKVDARVVRWPSRIRST